MSAATYDLVVVGGNAGGLSVAVSSQRSGVPRVRILEPGSVVAFADLVSEEQLDVGYGEVVQSIDVSGSDLVVRTAKQSYSTRACVVAQRSNSTHWTPPGKVEVGGRVLIDELPDDPDDEDALVVGHTDHAVELTSALAAAGARVVLAAGGMDPTKLSPAGERMLRRLERERRATLLYRAVPDQVSQSSGLPMAYFSDRRTPDLQFDHVVYASGRSALGPEDVGLTDAALDSGRVWFLGEPDEVASTDDGRVQVARAWRIGVEVASVFPELEISPPPSPAERRRGFTGVIEELRTEQYNATITHFEPTHSDLWVLRIRPDHGDTSHLPGQYASLGLGFWEDRIDDAVDPQLDERWDKLIRRSYSISSRIFDDHGYLAEDWNSDELEFYIVLVPPTESNVPGLTPRLALKRPGDRIYLGPKVAGRYTLAPVVDPNTTVLFLSTGTGEAPHNAMVLELLRKGHRGQILSAVSTREWVDLGYIDKHRVLEEHYSNYRYHPMPTRESDVPKQYIQDLLVGSVMSDQFGIDLDPTNTHVFLCGNPAMIGLPTEVDGETVFPDVIGVTQLLTERGFTLDHRKQEGNIHFEEYW